MSKQFAEEVLETLRKNGADITEPHAFEFYIYVPMKLYAAKAAAKIDSSGFTSKLSRSGRQWLITARKNLTPDHADLSDHARFLEQVAAAVGGEFDGWECEIVKPRRKA